MPEKFDNNYDVNNVVNLKHYNNGIWQKFINIVCADKENNLTGEENYKKIWEAEMKIMKEAMS